TRTLFVGNISKTRLDQRTSRRIIMVTTDRHGLRCPILDEISSTALFIILDGRYDRSLRAQRSVEGLRSKTLELLEYGYWGYFSDLDDEREGRTIMATMVRHVFRNPTLGQTPHLPSTAALCCHLRTVTSMTVRHKLR
ncbi:hypothetical protein EJD97_013156, partial [Solanum chilense]